MEEWKECTIGDICESVSETYSRKDENVVLINTSDVLEGKFLTHATTKNENLKGQFKKTFQKNDILYSEIRPANRRYAFVDFEKTENYIASTKLMVIRPNQELVLPRFLYLLLTSSNLISEMQHLAETRSGTFPQITFSGELATFPIKLPPLPTQQKIAAILSSLDDKIELNNKININLEQQAQALFKNWFVDFEPFGGKMPEGWKEKPLYDYADFINGTSFKEDEYDTKGVPIIKIAELKNGITEATQYFNGEKDPKYDVKNGDILFSWSGNPETSIDIFIWSLEDGILNQHTFNVKSHTNNKWFTYCLLKYFKPEFCHRASCKQTTGLGHVTASDLKQIAFSSGDKAVSDFENLIAPIMKHIFNNKLENQKLVNIRDTLLPKLMNGEIEV